MRISTVSAFVRLTAVYRPAQEFFAWFICSDGVRRMPYRAAQRFIWLCVRRLNRSSSAQMNRWAARYGIRLTPSEQMNHAKNSCAGRYTAVNLTNADTVEIRMFRGTLKLNTLKATLQMVNHLVEVAVSLSDYQVQDMSWFDFLDEIKESELIQYLKERRLYVNEPVNASEEE